MDNSLTILTPLNKCRCVLLSTFNVLKLNAFHF